MCQLLKMFTLLCMCACKYVYTHAPQCACKDHSTVLRSVLFYSRVLGIELRL